MLARDHVNSRPADVLVQGWDRGKPAAFDATVASPLTPVTLNNASTSVGAAAYAAELRKHVANDTRCQELGWARIPLTVETYSNWGMEAQISSESGVQQGDPFLQKLVDADEECTEILLQAWYLDDDDVQSMYHNWYKMN